MILAIRLGAMGDVIHALPAVRALRKLDDVLWLVEPRWAPLLAGQPFLAFDRSWASLKQLRSHTFEMAVDFQGLFKSAIPAWLSNSASIYGFDKVREPFAAVFYGHRVPSTSAHVVEQYMDLAIAAGARDREFVFDLPTGEPEGTLPDGPYVLASPLAGWPSKQWPLDRYAALAKLIQSRLGCSLVMTGSPKDAALLGADVHLCGLPGLIHATRGAAAVVGLDSGPMHLAAALGKPGVALFGPTDPARNGPYGGTFTVLRSPRAVTSYSHRAGTDDSLNDITPEQIVEALAARMKS